MAGRWVKLPANVYALRVQGWTNQLNNMPGINISDFDKIAMYELDDVARGPTVLQGIGSQGAIQHERCCNNMHDVFSNIFTGCTVHSLRMQPGQSRDDFTRRIAAELEKYTARDLVIFYYHGKAGEKEDEYTWRFRGPGPRSINAHDFICQVNSSRPNCYFILDCFVPTNFSKTWMRKKSMTEFSIAGHQMLDKRGRPINGPENFTETFCRAVRKVHAEPRGMPRPSIHQIMAKDEIQCSRPIRLWTARPNRKKDDDVWRFFVDVGEFKENAQHFRFRKCLITGRRPGDGEFDVDSDDDGDEDGDNDGDDGGDDDGDGDGYDDGNEDGGEDGNEDEEGDGVTNDDQDCGEDNNDTDAMLRDLRDTTEESLRDDPEALRLMRALHRILRPADQQAERAPNRQRSSEQQLPSIGLGNGEVVDLEGGNRGGDTAAPEGEADARSGASAPHLASNDDGEQQRHMNSRLSSPLIKRQHSPNPPSERKSIKRSTSSSPLSNLENFLLLRSESPIKRELSSSPGFEITGSRSIQAYIDLTSEDDLVDRVEEDEPEESLFLPQY